MTRNLGICITVLIAMLIVSGCVSTGKSEKMEMGKNQEIAALQGQGLSELKQRDLEQRRATWNSRRLPRSRRTPP